jgi:hypothetical protein
MVWTGSITAPNRESDDDARDEAQGTSGNAFRGGFMAVCQKESRQPLVGDAERIFAREPPVGTSSASSAL